MKSGTSGKVVIFLILTAMWAFCVPSHAQGKGILFRISVENAPGHIQAKAVKRFADELAERTEGVLDVRFHDSAVLSRDRDVFSALAEGKVEMAAPGTWNVARFEPNVSIFLLPAFYGRTSTENHRVLASKVGRELNRRVEDSLGVRVIGDWLDLGHAHIYTLDTRLNSIDNLQGLRIRVAGGKANRLRLNHFGAEAISVAWPDFPLWLERGEVDGVLTTHETIRSARLWERGIANCLEDREYFPMYVPMISARIWNNLSIEIRRIIMDTWEKTAEWERKEAARAQLDARGELVRNGVHIVVPTPEEIASWRKQLMKVQDAMIQTLGLDVDLSGLATKTLSH